MMTGQDIDYKSLSQEELDGLFITAVRMQDIKSVKKLHKNFANMLTDHGAGFTIAADNDDIKTLAYLLRHCEGVPDHVEQKLVTVFVENDRFDYLERLGKTLSVEKLDVDNYFFSDLAKKGNLRALKYFHEHGYDIRERDDWTLQQAAEGGSLEVVKFLVEDVGADIRARDHGALGQACSEGHLDVVEYLHKKGSSLTREKNYPLWVAAFNGHVHILEYLKDNGINLHKKCGASNAAPALSVAAQNGNVQAMEYLLENGADIHENHDQALFSALWNKNHEAIACLLRHGANIHARDEEWQEKNRPAHHALFSKAFNKVAFWRNNRNTSWKEPTMLSRAVYCADVKTVKDFLKRDANVTANDCRVVRDLCDGISANKDYDLGYKDKERAYKDITKTLVAHCPELIYAADEYVFAKMFFETHDVAKMQEVLPPEKIPQESLATLLKFSSYREDRTHMRSFISDYDLDVSSLDTHVVAGLVREEDVKTLELLLEKGLDENIIRKESPKLLFDMQRDLVAEQKKVVAQDKDKKKKFRNFVGKRSAKL